MFVITADQVDSRHDVDRSTEAVQALTAEFGHDLTLDIDQTSGDEIQAVTDSPDAAFGMIAALTRTGHWSAGLGVGGVRTPLPTAARKATGAAFISARDAVDAAKRSETRFALRAAGAEPRAAAVEALVDLLLVIRARRSPLGWEVVDLMRGGTTQKEAAGILGVSAAAVSQRLQAALWRVEHDARPALIGLLAELDDLASQTTPDRTDPAA